MDYKTGVAEGIGSDEKTKKLAFGSILRVRQGPHSDLTRESGNSSQSIRCAHKNSFKLPFLVSISQTQSFQRSKPVSGSQLLFRCGEDQSNQACQGGCQRPFLSSSIRSMSASLRSTPRSALFSRSDLYVGFRFFSGSTRDPHPKTHRSDNSTQTRIPAVCASRERKLRIKGFRRSRSFMSSNPSSSLPSNSSAAVSSKSTDSALSTQLLSSFQLHRLTCSTSLIFIDNGNSSTGSLRAIRLRDKLQDLHTNSDFPTVRNASSAHEATQFNEEFIAALRSVTGTIYQWEGSTLTIYQVESLSKW